MMIDAEEYLTLKDEELANLPWQATCRVAERFGIDPERGLPEDVERWIGEANQEALARLRALRDALERRLEGRKRGLDAETLRQHRIEVAGAREQLLRLLDRSAAASD
jgi:hypothetical protein